MKNVDLILCARLSLQFGLQPMLSLTFQDPVVSKVGIVIATELVKIALGVCFLYMETNDTKMRITQTWNIRTSLSKAALPAVLFALQNLLIQEAFTRLDSLTFNLMNQTKVCFIA